MHSHPSDFSTLLFDVLFGLLIFLGIDAFLEVRSGAHFVFYLVSMAVVLHWWLKYKASEDAYGTEVNNSTLDLLFGISEIALLQMALISAAAQEYAAAIAYFAMPLLIEAVWALIWRFFGKRRDSQRRVRYVHQQLEYTLFLNLGAAAILGTVIALSPFLAEADIVLCFAWAYAIYVFLTHRYEIIDMKLM